MEDVDTVTRVPYTRGVTEQARAIFEALLRGPAEDLASSGRTVPSIITASGGLLPPLYLNVDLSDRPPPSRRIRFRRWRRSAWYGIRESAAKLILPDGPWHESGYWDD